VKSIHSNTGSTEPHSCSCTVEFLRVPQQPCRATEPQKSALCIQHIIRKGIQASQTPPCWTTAEYTMPHATLSCGNVSTLVLLLDTYLILVGSVSQVASDSALCPVGPPSTTSMLCVRIILFMMEPQNPGRTPEVLLSPLEHRQRCLLN
jgi:hypothetical protein